MAAVVIPVLAQAGLSTFATLGLAAASIAGTYFVSDLLRGGPPKADAAERTRKDPKPARVYVLGQRRVYGASMLFTNTSASETVDVWAYCEGPINAVTKAYLNDDPITVTGGIVQALSDGSYGGGNVRAGWNLGANPNTAHAPVASRVASWTSAHRGDGIVSGYLVKGGVKSKNFLDIYPQGDNVEMSLVVQGRKCHDPRNPLSDPNDPATWSYTENAVLHLLWFKTVFKGADYARKIAPVEAYWIDAADICDEAMALAAGGTEPRYRGCVMFAADANPADIESELLACFDGWTAEDENGCIKVFAGKLYEPTVSIGPSQIIDYELQEFVEDENRINEIIVRTVSADHDYESVECEPWRNETDILERGKTVSAPLDLQVPSYTQGRRLGKRTEARTNAPQHGSVRVVYSAREALAERYINLLIEEAGETFFDGVAEVVGGDRDHETGGAIIEWVAVDPNVDSWNAATEDGEPAPTKTKAYLAPLAAPVIDAAAAVYDSATDAGTGVRVQIEATGPDRSDLTWFARWQVEGASIWNEQQYTDTDPGAAVELLTDFVPIAPDVNVQVAYQVGDGRVSPWSTTASVDTRTDLSPPDNATAITLTTWSDAMVLTTDRIARASSYRWRFYAADGTTLVRTLVTSTPEVSYTAAQAATDGPLRSYVVTVAGVNGAGAGAVATTSILTLDAPDAVTGLVAVDGATESEITFDPATGSVSGYIVAIATVASFNPMTQGLILRANGSPYYAQNLAAGTFYVKVAAYDAWTDRPDLLNFSSEDSFTITTGGGGVGGGGGDGGGGYCPEVTLPILMANAEHAGPGETKCAGDIEPDDWVWTRPELADGTLGEWGAYRVTNTEVVNQAVFKLGIGIAPWRATGGHRIWLSGWSRVDALGSPAGTADVVRITVDGAHTYFGNGLIHHNIKPE